jgi:Transposase, Mutator family
MRHFSRRKSNRSGSYYSAKAWGRRRSNQPSGIDDEQIKNHLDRIVRGSVEETLNALLEAEADWLCNAQRYERSEARRDTRAGHYERRL